MYEFIHRSHPQSSRGHLNVFFSHIGTDTPFGHLKIYKEEGWGEGGRRAGGGLGEAGEGGAINIVERPSSQTVRPISTSIGALCDP